MEVQSIATVLPVADVEAAAKVFAALLGAAPTFVDGPRWAQFDVGGRRVALAGTDRVSDQAGLMIKVSNLDEARAAAKAVGLTVSAPQEGPHEVRCVAEGPGGWPLILYAPRAG